MKTAYFFVLASLLLSSCSYPNHQRIKYNQIVGQWKTEDTQKTPLVIKFRKDQTYEVDFEGDGNKDVWGKIEFWQDKIKFTQENALDYIQCQEAGVYDYSIQRNKLDLVEFADECEARKISLKYPRLRIARKHLFSSL